MIEPKIFNLGLLFCVVDFIPKAGFAVSDSFSFLFK